MRFIFVTPTMTITICRCGVVYLVRHHKDSMPGFEYDNRGYADFCCCVCTSDCEECGFEKKAIIA